MVKLSDFAIERREQIKSINAQNKRRSKQMERRICKELGGNRVPMSGAGSLKGDGLLYSKFGLVIIECKYTAGIDKEGNAQIRFNFGWMPKLQSDVDAMKASFGVMVFRYHNTRNDFVVLPRRVYDFISNDIKAPDPVMIAKYITITLQHRQVLKMLYDNAGLFTINTRFGEYVFMDLEHFKSLMV